MVRHARVTGDLGIKNLSIASDDIKASAITTSKIGSALSVAGSVVKDGYMDYSPISTIKGISAVPIHDNSGSAPYRNIYVRIASGSVQSKRGSPGGYVGIIVSGDR